MGAFIIELRHLRYFIAVAEELHFGKAAQRLNISQPPLSQQIKQLEEELNITLFHRTNRSVEITESGKVLYEKAIEIINYVNSACEEAQSMERGEIGEVILGYSGSATFDLLPSIIKVCKMYYPRITLDLIQLTTTEQVKALEERKIHLGLLVSPIKSPLLNSMELRTEEFVVCLSDNHPFANIIGPIDPRSLMNENFIMLPKESGEGYYDSINLIFQEAGFIPNIVQTVKEQHTMVSLVAAGLGIVFVPKSTQAIKLDGIVYKNLTKSYPKVNSIAWNKNNKRPIINTFIKLIHEVVIPEFR